MKHFLSFILPCYNYADIIEEALVSIYKQHLSIPFEVICTDDASTDEKTKQILRKWDDAVDNFHAYYRDESGGECIANNLSVSHAQGDLFFCLDTDNVLVPDSVNKLIEHLDNTKCEATCFEELRFFKNINGRYSHLNSWFFKAPNNIVDLACMIGKEGGKTPPASGNYLFTRESYEKAGRYPEGNVMGSWSFGFRQLATGSRIAILPSTFYWHRFSEGGMYLTNQRKGLNGKAMMSVVLEFKHLFTDETQAVFNTDECKHSFTNCCLQGKIRLK